MKPEGFSVYVVEFVYRGLMYVLEEDTTVKLSEIQKKIGLPGKVTEAVSSDDTVISVNSDSGDWIITVLQSFTGEKELVVVIDSQRYVIRVKNDMIFPNPGNTWIPENLDVSGFTRVKFVPYNENYEM